MCQPQTCIPALICCCCTLFQSHKFRNFLVLMRASVEITLVQLQPVMDIPTNSRFPVDIYHSSVHDYVSEPSNCGLFEQQPSITSPHSLLAHSSFCLIILDILQTAGLLDALLELKRQSQAMQPHDPKSLRHSELAFVVESPESLQVLIGLGGIVTQNYDSGCRPWITMPGCELIGCRPRVAGTG